MPILVVIAFGTIASYAFSSICTRKINFKVCVFVYMIITFLLAFFAFRFSPSKMAFTEVDYNTAVFDISRYYIEIYDVGQKGWSYVAENTIGLREPLRYVLWYALSLLPSVKCFQAITVMVLLCTLLYCVFDVKKNRKCSRSDSHFIDKDVNMANLFFSLLILFSFIDFIEIINTGRYIIALFFAVAGIISIFAKKRDFWGMAGLVVASLIHWFFWGVLLLIIFDVFWNRVGKSKKSQWIKISFLAWRLEVTVLLGLLSEIPSSVVQFMIKGFEAEFNAACIKSMNNVIWLFLNIMFYVMIYLIIKEGRKNVTDMAHLLILDFLQLLLLIMIGGAGTNLAYRSGYIVAVMSPFYAMNNRKVLANPYWVNVRVLMAAMFGMSLIVYELLRNGLLMSVSGAYFQ